MRTIRVFCDDISTWWNKSIVSENIKRCRVVNTNEPYLKLELFNVSWEFYVYGSNNTSMLPEIIKNSLLDGCRPDLWFYDPAQDSILMSIEDTSTAPIGNAQKQRIIRIMWSIENKIPFIYVSPLTGMDNSQSKQRKITGEFKKLVDINPNSFLTPEQFNLKELMFEISINGIDKYKVTSPFTLNILRKSKINTKSFGLEFEQIKKLIDSDNEVLNIIEEGGNIFLMNKSSKTAKKLNIIKDTILLIGAGWKSSEKSKGYSDPFVGNIMMVYYINKWFGNVYDIIVLSTHDCRKYNFENLLKQNNKMTLALSKITKLMDLCGNVSKVTYTSNEKFEYKKDDESIATYCRYIELFNKNIVIDFCQPPHGSWSSKNGMNTQKRDDKRADIYHSEAPNGEEGKTKLSDVYKHIDKYGLIHDRYYFINEDEIIREDLKNKLNKVSF